MMPKLIHDKDIHHVSKPKDNKEEADPQKGKTTAKIKESKLKSIMKNIKS